MPNQLRPDEPDNNDEVASKHRESLFAGMNQWRLREQLLMAHDVMEEIQSISFIASESKMSPQERKQWENSLWFRLKGILRAEDICLQCGAKYPAWEGYSPHLCEQNQHKEDHCIDVQS